MATFGLAVTLPNLGICFRHRLGSPDGSSERAEVGLLGSDSIPTVPIANVEISHREVGRRLACKYKANRKRETPVLAHQLIVVKEGGYRAR